MIATRLRAASVVGLVLLLTGVLAVGVGALGSRPPAAEPPQAKAPAAVGNQDQHPGRTDRLGDPLPAGAVARIGSVRWWAGHACGPLVFTPDGKCLVLRERNGTVRVLDASSGQERRHIDSSGPTWNACFALAPSGKVLATGASRSPVIHIWDLHTGKELRRIEGDFKHGVHALAFSPDGKALAAGGYPTGIRLWETSTGKEIGRITGMDVGYDNGIAFLPDGKTLISGDRSSVCWWDMGTDREVRRINRKRDGKPGGFYDLAFSPDGKRIAAMNSEAVLLLWDAADGKEIRQVELGREYAGACLCFSPDGRALACHNATRKSGSQTLFFAAATGEQLRRWDEGDSYVDQMAYSPDGKTLAQTVRGVIRLRDAATGKAIGSGAGLPSYCLAVRFSRDGKKLIAGCFGGQTGSWDAFTGEPRSPLLGPPAGFGRHANVLLATALTAHGERAALVSSAGVLHVWDPATGKPCCAIAEPSVGEDQAAFSADGKVLAVKHRDNVTRLWDAAGGKLLRALEQGRQGHFLSPHPFSPDGRTLAVVSAFPEDTKVYLVETATGKEQARLVWRDGVEVTSLAFAPDGKYVLTAHCPEPRTAGGSALRLWDRDRGREVRHFPLPFADIRTLAFSPDSKSIAVALRDTIVLWEAASGAERGRFPGHRDWIWSLAFSPDGRRLASGSFDHTACVWDVTGICPDGRWPPRLAAGEDLERLWGDLGHKDGMRAYHALWRLAAAGPAGVPFLVRRLRPVAPVEERQLSRLIAELDSDQYEVRRRASAELAQLGERAEPALRKALAAQPPLEAARRLRALLSQVEKGTLTAEHLQALRAVEVLEHIGSGEARAVLRSLSAGASGAALTREAGAALERLGRRTGAPP